MNNTALTWGIVAVIAIVVIIGGWLLWQGNMTTPTINNITQNPITNTPSQPTGTTPKTYEVTYTDSGYAPASLTINKGDTVVFKNQSSGDMWVGSAMHPTHTNYNGTTVAQHCPDTENDDFDQCKAEGPGTSWSFTFNKTGEWGYHNHSAANKFGQIIVQ